MANVNYPNFIPCPHRDGKENPKAHDHLLRIGLNSFLHLCEACYGQLVIQVIDDLKTVKISPKP